MFSDFMNAVKSGERAEIMPAAIITAIISSILLLGIIIILTIVFQSKTQQTKNVELSTAVSNFDVSLRSDISQASFISATAKLTQPSTRLLSSTDLLINGITMHIPTPTGECKVIDWSLNDTTVSRNLIIYSNTLSEDETVQCDESSETTDNRDKNFSDTFIQKSPFQFTNQMNREFIYTLDDLTLNKVNEELEDRLTVQGVDKLSDEEFNELNNLLGNEYLASKFEEPDSCVMDEDKVDEVCPVPESATMTEVWSSTTVAKMSVDFDILGDFGEVVHSQIEQSASISPHR